ncbi:MAG: TetR/AcrR family transcriptional regulator [Caldilinea sp.]|nr:TetR/AcrR family transcriptional regulator [Caldilinea sp.]MDW8442742.1 TetR/AcrR family transcriptional regulator [Caldilineaceae bacterium]
MPRVVKEYDERYAEFLDVAQRLFYQKGYDQTSVQDIIQEMGVAKGLFYHYFRSKADLLDALIERMADQAVASLQPMVNDPTLDAQTKLHRFFDSTQNWKLANKAFMLELTRVLYRDENTLMRTKIARAGVGRIAPLLADILRQGVAEGVYDVQHPEESAPILLELGQSLANAMVDVLLNPPTAETDLEASLAALERQVRAHERAMERILGAPPCSIVMMTTEQLRAWFA